MVAWKNTRRIITLATRVGLVATLGALVGVGGAVADCSTAPGNLATPNNCNFTSTDISEWFTGTGLLSHNATEGSNAPGSLQCIGLGAGAWIWCTVRTCINGVSPSTEYNLGFDLKMTAEPPNPPMGTSYIGPFAEIRYQQFVDADCTTSAGSPDVVPGTGVNPIPTGSFTQSLGTVTMDVLTQSVQLELRVLNQDCNVLGDCGFTVVYDEVLFGTGLTPVELLDVSVE